MIRPTRIKTIGDILKLNCIIRYTPCLPQISKVALQRENVDATSEEVEHLHEKEVEGVGRGKAVGGGIHQPFIPLPGCPRES